MFSYKIRLSLNREVKLDIVAIQGFCTENNLIRKCQRKPKSWKKKYINLLDFELTRKAYYLIFSYFIVKNHFFTN